MSAELHTSLMHTATADRALLELIFNSAQDFYFIIGSAGERIFVSPSYYRISGYTPEDLNATDFRSRIHPDDLGVVERARAQNLAGQKTRIKYRSVCKDGSTLLFDLRAYPIVDAQGKLERIICCARDVSDRPAAIEAATAEEGRNRIRVLIVDDHAVLRKGLRMLLASNPDLAVVGEAADGAAAVELARSLMPDVIILDLTMPGDGGLAGLSTLRKECPAARILVLTMHDDPAYLKAVVASGGAGYVLKSADESEVLAAVRAVSQGRTYFSVSMNDVLVRALLADERSEPPHAAGQEVLSNREREVLALVAQGYTNQQVADQMLLSVKTVETYRSRLMTKLGLEDRSQLVRYAVQAGLLAPKSDDLRRN